MSEGKPGVIPSGWCSLTPIQQRRSGSALDEVWHFECLHVQRGVSDVQRVMLLLTDVKLPAAPTVEHKEEQRVGFKPEARCILTTTCYRITFQNTALLTSVIVCVQDVVNLISVECARHPAVTHRARGDLISALGALTSENQHPEPKRAAGGHRPA
ncbi:hypothetical protein EYF80_051574 [Liparis tanakae]|uniref:Uncharacterized protein n=1 Tax=Liparis tanakae TaxID=230148 RepID=A0A4Z2FBI1_9TELE|nr:hypothetical protein EYF80_051574 [Liparis tanakae]